MSYEPVLCAERLIAVCKFPRIIKSPQLAPMNIGELYEFTRINMKFFIVYKSAAGKKIFLRFAEQAGSNMRRHANNASLIFIFSTSRPAFAIKYI